MRSYDGRVEQRKVKFVGIDVPNYLKQKVTERVRKEVA